jgi:tetratricopeptide (TPR) repeat protein
MFFCDKNKNHFAQLFDKYFEQGDIEKIRSLIHQAEKQVLQEKDKTNIMQLYYDIASAYANIRLLSQEEQSLEKEILNYRRAIEIYEDNFEEFDNEPSGSNAMTEEKYIAMRTFCNLGNTFREMRRYLPSISCFLNALNISEDFAMASLNLSATLFEFSVFQASDRAIKCLHHAGYYYYKKAELCKLNLEGPQAEKELQRLKSFWIKRMEKEYTKDFFENDLEFQPCQYEEKDEIDYRSRIDLFRLFLNIEEELLPDSTFWVDDIQLPEDSDNTPGKEYIGLFNQIKEEYITARYLWYLTSELEKPQNLYADKENGIIDIGDGAVFSIRENLLRLSLKAAASLFDRIGYFINSYFGVGFIGTEISFKSIWKDKSIVSKGDKRAQRSIANPMSNQILDNPFLKAIYWLQKDFVQDNDVSLTSDVANRIVKMRNDMEHNCLRTLKTLNNKPYETMFTKYTSEGCLEKNTFEILKLLHETIIYLVLAVYIRNEGKKYS